MGVLRRLCVVTLLCGTAHVVGAWLAIRIPGRAGEPPPLDDLVVARRVFRLMAWIAAGLLSVRGVAGLVVDGTADPIWWPTFLVGGLLFGGIAWLSRPQSVSSFSDFPTPESGKDA